LERCLRSLVAVGEPKFEVVVVDNSGGDPATARIAADAGATYLREPRQGLSRARNAGAATAKGELLAFIDDDAVAETGWLRAHADTLSRSAAIGTTGRILPIVSEVARPATAPMLDLGVRSFTVDRSTAWWFELANFGGLGFGGNMVLRREVFDAGFRFTEGLGRGASLQGGEESYAFFSLIRDGGMIEYVPEAIVRHDGPAEVHRRAGERAAARRYSAYLCMLLAEEPGYRLRTARYVGDALRRPARPWRRLGSDARATSRQRSLLAALTGPVEYVTARLNRGGRRLTRD
jgi:glycosyltransferase involved in cell wall biosynthesis